LKAKDKVAFIIELLYTKTYELLILEADSTQSGPNQST